MHSHSGQADRSQENAPLEMADISLEKNMDIGKRVEALEENLSGLMGQVFVLNIAIGSLLATHHDRKVASRLMHERYEEALSIAIPHNLPDAFLAGMALTKSQLLMDQETTVFPQASEIIAGARNW